jgi:ABC-type branched-subunit amino acid transport system substrate-binding protein
MEPHNTAHPYQRRWLASVIATAVAIAINHWFVLGRSAFALAAALILLALGVSAWLRTSQRPVAIAAFSLLNAWIVIGFGLMKGFWATTLKVFVATALAQISTAFPKPAVGPTTQELSGVLMFLGSLFVAHYAFEIIATTRDTVRTWRPAIASGAVIALILSVAAYAATDRDVWREPADGVVKIGVIVPTGGPYALLGTSFVKAVQLAKDDLRNTRYRYELVIRDSGPDPQKAGSIIRQVIAEDRVDAILGGVSLIGQVTQPLAFAARIPHLCVCTVSAIGDGVYNFTNIPSPAAEGTMWAREARRRGIRTVAIVSQDYPSINNHVAAMKAEAARVGIAVAYENHFPETTSDVRSIVAGAQATHPDVIYVEALSPLLDLLGRELKAAGATHISSVVAPSLSDTPGLFEGAWYTDSNLRDLAFRTRFEQTYPGTRFATHMMPYAYDNLNMIVQAYERRENPAVYLRKLTTFDGTADVLRKPVGGGHFESMPAVWVISGGKPRLLK